MEYGAQCVAIRLYPCLARLLTPQTKSLRVAVRVSYASADMLLLLLHYVTLLHVALGDVPPGCSFSAA